MSSEKLKKLVVCYSFEGNTRWAAQTLASLIAADFLEIKPIQEIKTHGFMKYFWGGKQVLMKDKPVLAEFKQNPDQYDLILIGTPVWAFSYATPIGSFLERVNLKGKKIALFCTNEGGLGKTFINMRQALEGNEIVGELQLVNVLKNKAENEAKIKEWVKEIINQIG